MKRILLLFFALFVVASCTQPEPKGGAETFDPKNFHWPIGNDLCELYTLKNGKGMVVQVTNYGARLVSLWAPTNDGMKDIVFGYETINDYLENDSPYFGATIGRYAGRVAPEVEIDGVDYRLSQNSGALHMHGGESGFDKKVWEMVEANDDLVTLFYSAKSGEEGYPADMNIYVTYALMRDNRLQIRYRATASESTIVNMTNGTHFNLHGAMTQEVTSHVLEIDADSYLPLRDNLLPTGEIAAVEGTPFDFRNPTAIGEQIDSDSPQMALTKGYDHTWVLNNYEPHKLRRVAEIFEPSTGIIMTVESDQPGLLIYTGNYLDGTQVGKYGERYGRRTGFVLETQHYPDSPHHPDFPSTLLREGEIYRHDTVFTFRVKEEESQE